MKWRNKHAWMKVMFMAGTIVLLGTGCSFLYGDSLQDSEAVTDVTEADDPWEVIPFEAKNQDGEKVTEEDLSGDYWVANMVFTTCPTVCQTMTPNMVQVQEAVAEEDIDARIVSFTVDPEFDSPEQLTEYGEAYGADFENWDFLTGYSPDEISTFAGESFGAVIQEVPEQNDILHSTRFYLVNPDGQVIRFYQGEESFDLDAVIQDLENVID
ncbi:SCO family protein [Texcoconibacillus texcoconensis]|nr:SCO family protein [Texcoconibacillus texcoconensis]